MLSSRFQAVIELSARRAVGYEGLLVATNSQRVLVSPESVFASVTDRATFHELDVTARALHLRNFTRLGANNGRLFLNVSPSAAVDDLSKAGAFPTLVRGFGLEPSDVVVEILEYGDADEVLLCEAIAMYRSFGHCVALDDVHTRIEDLERIGRLRPEIVKVDRAITRTAAISEHDLLILREFVQTLHAFGTSVVIEGVETEREAAMALAVNADYAQGFHFGIPGRSKVDEHQLELVFAGLAGLGR